MKEAKFTNGNWEVVEASEHHGFYVEDSSGYTVADLYFISKLSEASVNHGDNVKANAHLIAAAPEMYEMLERFLPYSTFDIDGNETLHGGEFKWNEDDDPMIDELKKLLAKARGEA